MKVAGLQQIPDPQLHLGPVEGLRQEVVGAVRERLLFRLRRIVAGKHENGQIVVLRDYSGQLIHGSQAVNMRHMQVQQDEIGLHFLETLKELARVAQAANVRVTCKLQDGG